MSADENLRHLDTICRHIATGRGLARRLGVAVREFQLSEAEFRSLWLLHEQVKLAKQTGLTQNSLAHHLGISPAQVSAIVEKLRSRQFINTIADDHDRRRQRLRLTSLGSKQFESVVAAVSLLSRAWPLPNSPSPREDAA